VELVQSDRGMARLSKFLRLPLSEKILFIKAWILIGIIRVGLSLLPFIALKILLEIIGPFITGTDDRISEQRLAWAIAAASRLVPKTTCLAQALAFQLFLKQSGREAHVHIGVGCGEGGRLDAHAWVESRGKVLFGGSDLSRYTHLLALEERLL
jgi:hypothetical protein